MPRLVAGSVTIVPADRAAIRTPLLWLGWYIIVTRNGRAAGAVAGCFIAGCFIAQARKPS